MTRLAFVASLVLATLAVGCRKGEQRTASGDVVRGNEREFAARVVSMPKKIGIDVEVLRGSLLNKKGVLIAKLRLRSHRSDFVQVYFDKCELETTAGQRLRRANSAGVTVAVGPNAETSPFTLVFGRPDSPLQGDSFRIYLWAQATNGNVFLDDFPPVVLGDESAFKSPAQPLAKPAGARADELPHPTEPPPPMPPEAGGPAADSKTKQPCPHCGEPRGTATSCPHCGMP